MSRTRRKGLKFIDKDAASINQHSTSEIEHLKEVYSPSKRDNKDITFPTYGRRMKAYTKNNKRGKFAVDMSRGDGNGGGFKLGVSRTGKLVTKNANRSLKKAVRQESKNEIRNYLNQ